MEPTAAIPTAPTGPGRVRGLVLAADLVDAAIVAGLAVVAGLLGYAVTVATMAPGQLFGDLGALLVGAGVGTVVALVAAVVMLVATARGRSPGDRLARPDHGVSGPAAAAARLGRWIALALVAALTATVSSTLAEPAPAGVLGPSIGLGVAATAAVLAYWDESPPRRSALGVGAVAAVVGLALALAVPTRAPYGYELRAEVERALPGVLDGLGARRVCSAQGEVRGAMASHTLEPCHDPDQVWSLDGRSSDVAAAVATAVAADSGIVVAVSVAQPLDGRVTCTPGVAGCDATQPITWNLAVDDVAIAQVAATGCGTRVYTGPVSTQPMDEPRFLPDMELGDHCA